MLTVPRVNNENQRSLCKNKLQLSDQVLAKLLKMFLDSLKRLQ